MGPKLRSQLEYGERGNQTEILTMEQRILKTIKVLMLQATIMETKERQSDKRQTSKKRLMK